MLLGRRSDRDLDEEIRLHIEIETNKNVAAGHPPDEAHRLAMAALAVATRHAKRIATSAAPLARDLVRTRDSRSARCATIRR
jgi:hypothetical protein